MKLPSEKSKAGSPFDKEPVNFGVPPGIFNDMVLMDFTKLKGVSGGARW